LAGWRRRGRTSCPVASICFLFVLRFIRREKAQEAAVSPTHISIVFSLHLDRDSPRDQSPPQGILAIVLAGSAGNPVHPHRTVGTQGCGGKAESWDGGRCVQAAVGRGRHLRHHGEAGGGRVARYGTCWQGRITCQPERLRSLKLGVDKAAKRVQPHQFSVPSFSQRVASQQVEPVGIAERIQACVRIKGPRRPWQ